MVQLHVDDSVNGDEHDNGGDDCDDHDHGKDVDTCTWRRNALNKALIWDPAASHEGEPIRMELGGWEAWKLVGTSLLEMLQSRLVVFPSQVCRAKPETDGVARAELRAVHRDRC